MLKLTKLGRVFFTNKNFAHLRCIEIKILILRREKKMKRWAERLNGNRPMFSKPNKFMRSLKRLELYG